MQAASLPTTIQLGDSNLQILIDSLAGSGSGYVNTLSGATCTLVIAALGAPYGAAPPRTIVTPDRLTLQPDNRTLIWSQLASDTPIAGVYEIQLIANFGGTLQRYSSVGTLIVLPSP